MTKVNFFGASVTQQKTGYAQQFKIMNEQFYVNIYGYGSMHLYDAGTVVRHIICAEN